jgi:hypothetical protein
MSTILTSQVFQLEQHKPQALEPGNVLTGTVRLVTLESVLTLTRDTM